MVRAQVPAGPAARQITGQVLAVNGGERSLVLTGDRPWALVARLTAAARQILT